ncbi:DUF6471 domain-containing protein [Phenylobacterium sp.]|uniref:DUF6471 domain-containing protein n=1 Tax=Phenylobacterium sp. TaxID=1871053 RepID=UPI00345C4F7C
MKRRNLTFAALEEKLASLGVRDSERNLRNKISQGGFTGAFLIRCPIAIGVSALRSED